MRNRFIGDSLDLAKRRLLEITAELNWPTLVAPLPPESAFEFERYVRVLGVRNPHGVYGREGPTFRARTRKRYLAGLSDTLAKTSWAGLLLDPDSGVSKERENNSKYLSTGEISSATCMFPGLWLVYHHQSTAGLSYQAVIAALRGAFAYDFGFVADNDQKPLATEGRRSVEGRVGNLWQTCQAFWRRFTNWAIGTKSPPGRSTARKRSSAATTAAHLETLLRFQQGLRRMQNNLGRALRAVRRAARRRTGR